MLDPVRFYNLLLALFMVVCVPSVVLAINLNGTWTYREFGGDDVDTFRELRQNYSFGVGPALTYKPSHALTANASVSYTQSDEKGEESSRTSKTITPTVALGLANDIFAARFSGNTASRKSDGSEWANTTSWSTNLSSQWSQPFVPQFRFTYGESGEDSQGDAIGSPSTQRKDFGAGVDWDLSLANLSYRYRDTSSEDGPSSDSHFVTLETTGWFWDNRIIFSLSQQAQFDSQEVSGSAGETTFVSVGKTVRVASSPDDAPVDYNCEVTSTPGVDCLVSAAFPITYPASSHVQIAIDSLETRRIGAVDISFNADFDRAVDSVWDLYEWRPNSQSWQLIALDLPIVATTEDVVQGITIIRHRIEIPETDREFMLVSDLRVLEGRITGVDAFELVAGGSERKIRRYRTNAGVQMRLSETVSSSLTLTYDREESEVDGGDEPDFDSDKITTGGNLNWRPYSFLFASLGASEYRERTLGEDEVRNPNYSLVVSLVPLPTLNVSLGVQLNERYGGELEDGSFDIDQKVLETMRYSFTGKAQIYPDLSANFTLSYIDETRWLKDEGVDIWRPADRTAQSARLDLNAELYEDLTADLITRYILVDGDGADRETGDAQLGLRYWLSDLLLIRGSYETEFIGRDDPDSLNLTLQVSLLDTDKTRLEAQFVHSQAEEVVERISFNGIWLVGKNISLTGRGGYTFGETNNYAIRLDLRIGI